MKQKKESINLSLCIIIVASILSAITYVLKCRFQLCDFLFALFVGITGSACATLFIFIHEYNDEKKRLIEKIFIDGYSIYKRLKVLRFQTSQLRVDEYAVIKNFEKRYYQNPKDIKTDSVFDKAFYELCCFVDRALEINLTEIYAYNNLIDELDFWKDTLKKSNSKKTLHYIAHEAIVSPISNVLIGKCEAERDYTFFSLTEYKMGRMSAAEAYCIIKNLYIDLWENRIKQTKGFVQYFYMELYAFRCFFDKNYKEKSHKKASWDALKNGTEFQYVR